MDLLANYASSDEEEHEELSHPKSQRRPPAKPAKSESESADAKDEGFLPQSAPKLGGIFSSLPPPKSSLFNSLPPLKSQSFPNPEPPRREGDVKMMPKSSSSSLFSSLPRPQSSSSASSSVKKVVQFKPPMMMNSYSPSLDEDEDDDDKGEEERKRKKSREAISTSSASLFLSSIPAPKHSATLGVMPSASGTGRRSMLETSATASNVSTVIDADANPSVEHLNNQSNDGNYAYSSWGSESETPAYYSENGTGNDGFVNSDSSYAYNAYGGASTDVSSASTAGIDTGINPNTESDEAVYYSYAEGQHVEYSNYGGGYGNNWESSIALPVSSGVLENVLPEIGKRGRKDVSPVIVEVNQDELMKDRPREDQVKATGIAFGPVYQPASTKGKPTKLHKRKHQIGSLYFDMRQKESELAERRSRGFLTKAQTQGKYGW